MPNFSANTGWVTKATPLPPYHRERESVPIVQKTGGDLIMVCTGGENLAHTDYDIVAHFGCVFVALVIQHAQRMRHILSYLATFPH